MGNGPVEHYAFEYTTGLDMIAHAARVGFPVSLELVLFGEVAQGLEQHSRCLDGGDGGAGIELTLAYAHHDAGGRGKRPTF